ncbi:MAG TPA: carboxypeptidase regulatory-like domain-containing protein [Gemmatimonadaceae bacterium]|nr:carboxypeptidase regulatory-like domain-containing protein [Gemmatimonadaceae bacterium]
MASNPVVLVTARAAALGSLLLVIAPLRIAAQQAPRQPRPGRGNLIGVVVDTLGRPLDSVQVFIAGHRRSALTPRDGTFRFDSIGTDTVTVTARRTDHYPSSKLARLAKDGGTLVFELIPRLATLPVVVTEATLSGVRGVVSDTAFHAIAGADIQALGGRGGIVHSDSLGAFFLDVTPGQYMVRVTKPGMLPQMIGVTVPPTGGRRLAVHLEPGTDPYHARRAWAVDGITERLERRSAVWSHVYSREDIARLHVDDVVTLAKLGAIGPVSEDCSVSVNGLTSAPLWSINPDDIEFFEVYARMPAMGMGTTQPHGVTSINGNTRIRTQGTAPRSSRMGGGAGGSCPEGMFVWTAR